MKTPEEIKKGLECCYSPVEPMLRCEACPYYGSIICKMRLHTDSLAYIQQLERDKAWAGENYDLMREELARLQRERDAAVKILTDIAHYDDWFGGVDICVVCKKDKCKECVSVNGGFEWRGVPEQEKDEPIRAD